MSISRGPLGNKGLLTSYPIAIEFVIGPEDSVHEHAVSPTYVHKYVDAKVP